MKRLVVATAGALSRVDTTSATPKAPVDIQSLTAREQQVARAVAGGASNKEVARTLNITERTIKAHVSAIFLKLGARDRLHLSLIMNGHRIA